MTITPREPDPELRKLYPTLTDEELLEVEEAIDKYLKIVIGIFERVESSKSTRRAPILNDPDLKQQNLF